MIYLALIGSLLIGDLTLDPTPKEDGCSCLKWTQTDGGYDCALKACPTKKPAPRPK